MADLCKSPPPSYSYSSSSDQEFSTFFNQFLHQNNNNKPHTHTDAASGGPLLQNLITCDDDDINNNCENKCGGDDDGDRPRSSSTIITSSSKRSRAAEVHNMSEKRRRSRINEKMKALQCLIPNSNKTDKASMLDEAIEYLKDLQLQVQMLSMRNGLGLNPLCLPGVLHPMQQPTAMSFDEGNGASTCSANVESLNPTAFNLSNQSIPPNESIVLPSGPSMTSQSLFGFEPHTQLHYGPFNHHASHKEFFKVGTSQLKVDADETVRNTSSGLS
ncbi:hypothetical protein ACFE04_008005 [Oxalis oulophora]